MTKKAVCVSLDTEQIKFIKKEKIKLSKAVQSLINGLILTKKLTVEPVSP
jgi:hypothetical protein